MLRVTLLGLALFSFDAWAGCTSHSSGTFTYTSCSNGVSGISQRIGSTTLSSFSNGGSATSYSAGNTTYHTGPGGRGTTYRSGRYAQHHWSDGSHGHSRFTASVARHEWDADAQGAEIRLGSDRGSLDYQAALAEQQRRRSTYAHIAGPRTLQQ